MHWPPTGQGSRWRVVQTSTPAHELGDEIIELGSEAHILSEDISSAAGAHKLVSDAVGLLGGIDLLIHCASTFKPMPFEKVNEDGWNDAIQTNLGATFFLTQATVKAMASGGGRIILFSDSAAMRPYGDYLPYCISKAGVEALVRGLAMRIAPKITINAIAPYVVTKPDEMNDSEWDALLDKMPMQKSSSLEEIVSVVRMLANSETMTGQVITVDGGRSLI